MKRLFVILFFLFSLSTAAQELKWIPFDWQGISISGKYFDKAAITVPVTLEKLPYRFNMQFDLGAITTMVYGNSFSQFLEKYDELKNKIDTTLVFWGQGKKHPMFKDMELKLGDVAFGKRNIGYFKGFGDSLSLDSINTSPAKIIGTIAPDIFQDNILIIDFPNKRICLTDTLSSKYAKAVFQPYQVKAGRIKIPLMINNKLQYLLFDTGSSIFSLLTSSKNAEQVTSSAVVDSMIITSWDKKITMYGRKANAPVKFGELSLQNAVIYYDQQSQFDKFYEEEKIWGITGNAYFLKNTVIIDYRHKRFGIL